MDIQLRLVGFNSTFDKVIVEEISNLKTQYHSAMSSLTVRSSRIFTDMFTGRLDSARTKIYNNDIISIPSYRRNGDETETEVLFLVNYGYEFASFGLVPFPKGNIEGALIGIEEFVHDFTFLEDYSYFQVIGTVYENSKELLGMSFKDYEKNYEI